MRILFVLLPLMFLAVHSVAEPAPTNPDATVDRNPATWRNEADWADREAQARIVDGDYDGAVLAARRADADRNQASQSAMAAGSAKR